MSTVLVKYRRVARERAVSYMLTEEPTLPGVYSVLIRLHDGQHPKPHEPELFAYWDGIDTWSAWEFSVYAAYRAKMMSTNIRYGWCRKGPL
jgi:hypothetical protein